MGRSYAAFANNEKMKYVESLLSHRESLTARFSSKHFRKD